MLCPCGGHLTVKDSRPIPEGYWRRRRCVTCLAEYTTVEQFCVTEPGQRGRKPVVKVPKPPVIKAVKPRKPAPAPVVPAATPVEFLPKPSVRQKLERLKLEKELQKSNSAGWD